MTSRPAQANRFSLRRWSQRKLEAARTGVRTPVQAPPPADVAAPPADAVKTKSGLASKMIKAGSGKEHPRGDDFVTVTYTGWTTDGKMFDSSVGSPTPARK